MKCMNKNQHHSKFVYYTLNKLLNSNSSKVDPCTWCIQVQKSPKEASAAAMQSWRERCEKCVCLQADYVEKCLHFQLPVVSSFFK